MAEGASSIGHLNQCAHPGCLCQTNPGERYCSEYCRLVQEGKDGAPIVPPSAHVACGCGHAGCQ